MSKRPAHPVAVSGAAAAAVLAVITALLPGSAGALPRYSARYGQTCALCHVNPGGGGMRTAYASQYLVPVELAMTAYEPEELERIRPDVSPTVSVGLDLRTLVYQGEADRSGSIAMQGDVYTAVQLDEKFIAYLDVGRGGAREFFGLAYVLPWNGYLKAGQFTPDYGWRWADHQMASRLYLFEEEGDEFPSSLHDPGIEVGVHRGPLRLSGSLLNGSAASRNGESFAGRAVARLSEGAVNLALGASILRREEAEGHRRAVGGFGYAVAGPAAWVFEVDETRNPLRTGLLVSNELTVAITQGFNLRAVYSFQDPDRDLETGTRSRYGLGFDALTTPFFGVLLMGHRHDNRQGLLVDEPDHYQGELVLHFLY